MCGQIVTKRKDESSSLSDTVIQDEKTTGPLLIHYERMKNIHELYGTEENLWTGRERGGERSDNPSEHWGRWGSFLREETAEKIGVFSSIDELTWLLTNERKQLFHKRQVFQRAYVYTFIGLDIREYMWKTFPRTDVMEQEILRELERKRDEENKPFELEYYE